MMLKKNFHFCLNALLLACFVFFAGCAEEVDNIDLAKEIDTTGLEKGDTVKYSKETGDDQVAFIPIPGEEEPIKLENNQRIEIELTYGGDIKSIFTGDWIPVWTVNNYKVFNDDGKVIKKYPPEPEPTPEPEPEPEPTPEEPTPLIPAEPVPVPDEPEPLPEPDLPRVDEEVPVEPEPYVPPTVEEEPEPYIPPTVEPEPTPEPEPEPDFPTYSPPTVDYTPSEPYYYVAYPDWPYWVDDFYPTDNENPGDNINTGGNGGSGGATPCGGGYTGSAGSCCDCLLDPGTTPGDCQGSCPNTACNTCLGTAINKSECSALCPGS